LFSIINAPQPPIWLVFFIGPLLVLKSWTREKKKPPLKYVPAGLFLAQLVVISQLILLTIQAPVSNDRLVTLTDFSYS